MPAATMTDIFDNAEKSVADLAQQAKSSLSLDEEQPHTRTNAAADAIENALPNDTSSLRRPAPSTSASDTQANHRPANAIGSGGGGPPSRFSSPSVSQSTNTALRSSVVGRIGAGGGGPQSRYLANEMTKQNATTRLPPSVQARMAATANRSSSSGSSSPSAQTPGGSVSVDQKFDISAFTGGSTSPASALPSQSNGSPSGSVNFRVPPGLRPAPGLPPGATRPGAGPMAGLAGRRKGPGLKLSDLSDADTAASSGAAGQGTHSEGQDSRPTNGSVPPRRLAPPGKLASAGKGLMSTAFDMHKNIVDPSGRLRFDGKAVLSASGVEFRNGTSFAINMEDLSLQDELGKGAYGTVRKVRHTKTGVEMAMKEIRLELDDSKLNGIIMELDILHRATAPEIVEFYGAFFWESCVYYCIEFMDAGSLENLYDGRCSVPEDVLARIVGCTVRGLRFLKDNLQIMHRDVKPTNILLNCKGQVKLCDFGVSGQLEKSLAKTNIGCQSYMAPERIKGESQNLVGTYTVASDVWSLGLTIVETTLGTYPYPPETYSNVFAQLQAIVHGDPPQIPIDYYSATAANFVAGCLEKVPAKRATYKQMLEHPWLQEDLARGPDGVDMSGWITNVVARKKAKREQQN